MMHGRPDIDVPIAFLSTQVRSPNDDDWKKLQRVICWLKCTINETRYIGADNLTSMLAWIDVAYAVHSNMRSNTGGAMSMGLGVLHERSGKQKLNTKSFTETEVVGFSDYLSPSLWYATPPLPSIL